MAELRQKYGNDLRVVSKQMVVHPNNAMAGALAFCAANKQGKAKQMDDLIWDKGFKQRQLDNSAVSRPPRRWRPGGAAGGKCWDQAEAARSSWATRPSSGSTSTSSRPT